MNGGTSVVEERVVHTDIIDEEKKKKEIEKKLKKGGENPGPLLSPSLKRKTI